MYQNSTPSTGSLFLWSFFALPPLSVVELYPAPRTTVPSTQGIGCHVGLVTGDRVFQISISANIPSFSGSRAISIVDPPPTLSRAYSPPATWERQRVGIVSKGQGVPEFNSVHRVFFLVQLLCPPPSSFVESPPRHELQFQAGGAWAVT